MKNLLVIDDDENITRLLKKYFTKMGHNVVTANNGAEGLNMFINLHNFDAVITEIDIPGLNGNDVGMLLRKTKKKKIPVIAITGLELFDFRYELFDEVLTKPFRFKTLSEIIDNC